ncbi:hypothetical protein SLEP1_g6446 [Rubroshorea leprosula]|uniref:Uncharacterized protein n=1 Tax=Rubroshorea leprosula TaxID=152421 RepID=A0AAV5I141_9ROSI|nr:hypothetical protein SLEP1_g6446 [Rubroshorea leprosula]
MRSMSVTSSFCPQISVKNFTPVVKHANKLVMLEYKQVSGKKATKFQIKSSFKNKVFEDRSEGIVCYRDESGEIVCEGYDEGPRFHNQISRPSYHPRDAEIFDLLQQRWLQIVNGDELNSAGKGVIADSKWNGFNKFL